MRRIKEALKKALVVGLAGCMIWSMTGCGSSKAASGESDKKVVIYSNADDEAIEVIEKTLDANGYKDQYIVQTFGTSELGGKLLSEGSSIEADLVTMSSYYIDSAQKKNNMFKQLTFTPDIVDGFGTFDNYLVPFLANQGAILINTDLLEEEGLPMPTSIKDLANPEYKGHISTIDIEGSSTAWLMVQALVAAYGDDEAAQILSDIYANAGENIEQSGSGPLKKIRAGEVAVGFGLRHQAVADKASGLPVDYVDPTEGNYTLTESLAVVDHKTAATDKALEMVKCIIEKGRTDLMTYYPVPLFAGETANGDAMSANSKVFPEALTVELLEKHIEISKKAKDLIK